MTALAALQAEFLAYLRGQPARAGSAGLGDDAGPAGLRNGAGPAGMGHDAGIVALLAPGARAPADRMLRVYGDAYRARLAEALANDVPRLRTLVGAQRFARLAAGYAAAVPSRHPSLRWFGQDFAAWLALQAPSEPWLAELAAFEWAQGLVFDAADVAPVGPGALQAVPAAAWPTLRFRFVAALRRLDLAYAVPALWLALAPASTDPAPPNVASPSAAPAAIAPPAAEAAAWLVWRVGHDVRFRALEADEAAALDAARAGADFAAVCEDLAHSCGPAAAPARAAAIVAGWAASGLVAELVTGTDDL